MYGGHTAARHPLDCLARAAPGRIVQRFNLHPRPVGWQHYNPSLQTSARNNWALRTRTSSSKDLRAFYAEAHMGSQVAHLGPCRGRCNPTVMVPHWRASAVSGSTRSRSGQAQLVLRAAKCIDNPISPRRPTDQSSISMRCGLCAPTPSNMNYGSTIQTFSCRPVRAVARLAPVRQHHGLAAPGALAAQSESAHVASFLSGVRVFQRTCHLLQMQYSRSCGRSWHSYDTLFQRPQKLLRLDRQRPRYVLSSPYSRKRGTPSAEGSCLLK